MIAIRLLINATISVSTNDNYNSLCNGKTLDLIRESVIENRCLKFLEFILAKWSTSCFVFVDI